MLYVLLIELRVCYSVSLYEQSLERPRDGDSCLYGASPLLSQSPIGGRSTHLLRLRGQALITSTNSSRKVERRCILGPGAGGCSSRGRKLSTGGVFSGVKHEHKTLPQQRVHPESDTDSSSSLFTSSSLVIAGALTQDMAVGG